MKKPIMFHKLLPINLMLGILLTSGFSQISAQEMHLNLFCDRNIYAAGEEIKFSAFISYANSDTSDVLYLDLISSAGIQLGGKKYILHGSHFNATYAIPPETASGSYFLRATTSGLKQNKTNRFAYIPLQIINAEKEPFSLYSAYQTTNIQDTNEQILPNTEIMLSEKSSAQSDSLEIELNIRNKENYKHLAIAMVPKASVFYCDSCEVSEESNQKRQRIYEKNGLAVNGKVLDIKTNAGLKNANIFLSYPANKNIFASYTDSLGNFSVILPFYSESGKLILALEERIPDINPVFQIQKDFEPIPEKAIFPKFELNETQKHFALKLAQNQQLKNEFYNKYVITDSLIHSARSFYVKEDVRISLQDYIPLPELKDYFTEIDLVVKLEKINGTPQFRIKGEQPELNFYKPLVLIDYVYVQNATEILQISPRLISHIEIVNHLYLKGEFIFGGIINFITKNNDFGGLKFSESTITFDYQFIHQPEAITFEPKNPEKAPDLRNTFFWNTYSAAEITNLEKIRIKKPTNKGEYLIHIQSLDNKNNILHTYKRILIE